MSLIKKSNGELIRSNSHYHDISKVFGNPDVKDFFKKYMTDKHDEILMLKIGKLYIFLQDKFKEETGRELSDEETIGIIDHLIKTPETRRTIIHHLDMSELLKRADEVSVLDIQTFLTNHHKSIQQSEPVEEIKS